jgi:hypothetical protein
MFVTGYDYIGLNLQTFNNVCIWLSANTTNVTSGWTYQTTSGSLPYAAQPCSTIGGLDFNMTFEFTTEDIFILNGLTLFFDFNGGCYSRFQNMGDGNFNEITIGQAFLGQFHVIFDDPNNQIGLGISLSTFNTAVNGPWLSVNPNPQKFKAEFPKVISFWGWIGIIFGSLFAVFCLVLLYQWVCKKLQSRKSASPVVAAN